METVNTGEYFKINPKTIIEIRKNFNLEQPGAMSDAIDILEEWMKKQEHFVKKDFDRTYLERTIIRAKGSLERAKQRLDKLCSAKTLMPKLFAICRISELTHLDNMEDAFLPKLTPDNYRVYLLRLREKEFPSQLYPNFYKRIMYYLEYTCAYDYSNGSTFILDYRETNIASLVKGMDLVDLKNMFSVSFDCYGLRVTGIHIISESKFVDLMVTVFKQVLSHKIGSRIHVHNTIESVYKYVDKDVLPVEYGGTEKPLSEVHKQILNEIGSDTNMEYMKMMSAACTDETLRPQDKYNDQCLGMPGTFRSLRID